LCNSATGNQVDNVSSSDELNLLSDYNLAVSRICEEIWNNSKSNDHKTYLIFDDCQAIENARESQSVIRLLVDQLPYSYSVVLMGRTRQSIFAEKQMLEKESLELTAADLRFTEAEIEEVISNLGIEENNRRLTQYLATTTEGWIAATILLAEEYRGQFSNNYPKNERLLKHKQLNSYIASEVFGSTTEPTMNALCKLSLLNEFTQQSAAAIFKITDLNLIFSSCPGIEYFIKEMPGYEATYCFHKAIKDYLLNSSLNIFSAKQLAEYHYCASCYYIENNLFSIAAEHIASCTATDKTMEIVTNVGIRFMLVGDSGQLKNWLDRLPDDLIMINPVLLIFKALLMPHSAFKEAESLLNEALKLSQKAGDLMLQYRAATSLVFIYFCQNNMDGILRITNKINVLLKKADSNLNYMKNIVGIMHSIGSSSYPKGHKLVDRQNPDVLMEEDLWLYLAYATVIATNLRKLAEAQTFIKRAFSLNCVKNVEPAKATALYLYTNVLSLTKEDTKLPASLEQLTQIAEKYDFSYFLAGNNKIRAYDHYLNFDVKTAMEHLDKASLLYLRGNNRAMSLLVKLLKLLWDKQRDTAISTLKQLMSDLEELLKHNPGQMLEEISLSLIGALAHKTGHHEFAEECLLSSIKKASSKKANQILCGSYFHLAHLYFITGKIDLGKRNLKHAMNLASEYKYKMFWDIHLPTITASLLRAISYHYSAVIAEELLAGFYNQQAARYLIEKSKNLNDTEIDDFINRFLFNLEKNQLQDYYLVRATLFGNAEIFINGVKINETAWKTKKNKSLLEYLLLHNGEPVVKEQLIDFLWPQSDKNSAKTSLRTALYQIRKILKENNVDTSGSKAFIMETPETLQIPNSSFLELDLNNFNQLAELFLNDTCTVSRPFVVKDVMIA